MSLPFRALGTLGALRAASGVSAASAGRDAEMAVPAPGSDSTCSVPDSASIRCRIATRPKPLASAGSKPRPSSRTSRATWWSMYDRVSPTLAAWACLATLASPSWAVRSSATSTSGGSGRTVPVVVTWTGTPCRVDQRPATLVSASLSRAVSSGSGRSASTERRASVRLSRASRVAAAKCLRHPAGSSAACSAACSWVTIPVRPWARVSWISRAIRCRSSRIPASLAWVSNCWCRPAFSASVASSLLLASLTSARASSRRSFCWSLYRSSQVREHIGSTLTASTAR